MPEKEKKTHLQRVDNFVKSMQQYSQMSMSDLSESGFLSFYEDNAFFVATIDYGAIRQDFIDLGYPESGASILSAEFLKMTILFFTLHVRLTHKQDNNSKTA